MDTRDDFSELFHAYKSKKGVELGVGGGQFSYILNKSYDNWDEFYAIDRWAGDRGHDIREYNNAYNVLSKFLNCRVLRASFDEALKLFPDGYFDFIYIDGYAHTGQEQGDTLKKWFPKLKNGGVFAGHDYHPDWPLTIKYVDEFCNNLNIKPYFTKGDKYPSWYFIN